MSISHASGRARGHRPYKRMKPLSISRLWAGTGAPPLQENETALRAYPSPLRYDLQTL